MVLIPYANPVSVKHVKFTSNNNLLLYIENENEIQTIMRNTDLFDKCKKIYLKNSSNKHFLVIKNIGYDAAIGCSDELKNLRIEKIEQIEQIGKNNKLNLVKVIVYKKETAELLKKDGIKLYNIKYTIFI